MASDSLPTPPSPTATPAATAASGSQSTADAPSPAAGLPVPPATAAAAAGAPPAPPTLAEMLESLLQQIVASNSPSALAATLRNAVGTREAREEVLMSMTSTGADPLEALDVVQHTIGALYILYVPLNCHRYSSFGRICAPHVLLRQPGDDAFRGFWVVVARVSSLTQVCTSHVCVNDCASFTVRVHR